MASTNASTGSPQLINTRFLIISDTHNSQLASGENVYWSASSHPVPFREPLPKADVLLHCGDLTMIGLMDEYQKTLDMLMDCDADLKLVIAGNHDISLDEKYYRRRGKLMHAQWGHDENLPALAKEMWTGERARIAGVIYLEEGTHTFTLKSGAKLRVYASPYQPEFCDWAFPYERNEDRFNRLRSVVPGAVSIVENPVPDFPAVDVMMTHGPPLHILDKTNRGESVGCEHLLRAARRCKPRIHCFGHIHEAWGAARVLWNPSEELKNDSKTHVAKAEAIQVDYAKMVEERAVFVDVSSESGARPLDFGKETLMVNASIMNLRYKPRHGPWLIDVDLERSSASAADP
ncbi:ser/Thr protein phosphatase family protein [Lepidopterella palustris CBS 459.81]|uniref:Ser/Thr protein phosphatase family protein n=1 Tax=Lepidopterella palustris CBS 459.81 TaxID=1314670 RepID=A0A8E2E936_9PEZI|nr:ser/Thr protein phosphatase family protein [Lepidopterella palustris CBS 459.81]